MPRRLNLKNRKEIESKMLAVLREEMRPLSKDLQKILVDDLVTAFENRLNVMGKAQTGLECMVLQGEYAHKLI